MMHNARNNIEHSVHTIQLGLAVMFKTSLALHIQILLEVVGFLTFYTSQLGVNGCMAPMTPFLVPTKRVGPSGAFA